MFVNGIVFIYKHINIINAIFYLVLNVFNYSQPIHIGYYKTTLIKNCLSFHRKQYNIVYWQVLVNYQNSFISYYIFTSYNWWWLIWTYIGNNRVRGLTGRLKKNNNKTNIDNYGWVGFFFYLYFTIDCDSSVTIAEFSDLFGLWAFFVFFFFF